MEQAYFKAYKKILEEELLPAMGCTEPVAVAYAAALARDTLGALPCRVEVSVSGNILKNVKSVVVPNTGGMRGVAAAVAAGIAAGNAEAKLGVLEGIGEGDLTKIASYLQTTPIKVKKADTGCIFDIGVHVFSDEKDAFVRIEGYHTNVVEVTLCGACVKSGELYKEGAQEDRSCLTVERILEYADTAPLADFRELVERQIVFNSAISEEGLTGDYGARVGKTLLAAYGNAVHNRAKAAAAAGSDARMNGCSLPVVIVSGSGNQGMTASLPVIVYAKELGVPHERLLRAVLLSDLITIHLKTGIGRLSAYCGAVSAGAGAGAGVCYLHGGRVEEISHTVVNALAITSGLICDGAKSSCAGKIAAAVDAGLLGFEMCRNGCEFHGGDGILEKGVEQTIDNVGDLARVGMRGTDEEIIRLMIKNL